MASRHKKHGKGKADSPDDPRQETLRLMEKGRFKDAVRQAKIVFRDHGTAENHVLLERAYLGRVRQLQEEGMPASAEEVARHLLDFGVTEPEVTATLTKLLPTLGLTAEALRFQDRLEEPEALGGLLGSVVDAAVIDPKHAPASRPEIRENALRVRSCLEALEDGRPDEEALAPLRDIPRHSPFADWKLFARGLAAYHRGDLDEMRANWGRLDPQRASARIAAPLRGLAEPDGSGASALESVPSALETAVLHAPVLARLREMHDRISQGRWTEILRDLGDLRKALQQIDPALSARITEALYAPLLKSTESADTEYQARSACASSPGWPTPCHSTRAGTASGPCSRRGLMAISTSRSDSGRHTPNPSAACPS